MTNKSVNLNPESTPFTINADILDTPIIVCDNNFKIVYKNRAASYLKLRRLGSYITSYISSEHKLLLQKNDFEINPCIFLTLNLTGNQSDTLSAYVCPYSFKPNCTIWIIPKITNTAIWYLNHNDSFQNKMLSFIPLTARCIIANESSNHIENSNDIANIIAKKCVLTSINYLSGITPASTIGFEYISAILRRFILEHIPPIGYSANINLAPTSNLFLVCNSNEFLCLYLNLLICILDCSNQPFVNIDFKIEGNMAVIETKVDLKLVPLCQNDLDWLAFTYQSHSYNFTICCKLCQLLGFDVTILPCNEEPYNCKVLMKSRVCMPGLLRSPSDDDFDVMYNKFIYFLKYI